MAENKRTCTFDGCGKPSRAGGYCGGHYYQQWHGKPLTALRRHAKHGMTMRDRLDMHTNKTGDCWIWTAWKNSKGYGHINVGGKLRGAHRVAYELAHGPIPKGVEIDHKCHTRACVRPDHLRPATHKQNLENQVGARPGSKSGVRGVYWNAKSQKWVARVGHNGQIAHLGLYATIEEAEVVVIAKRNELFTHNDADRILEV